MNSFQWIQIYEFDTMDSYIWIHILINSYAYEFINEFRISTIEFIYMNSCTHQFIWLFPSSSMKSYRLWIHKIMSYMNSYVFGFMTRCYYMLLHIYVTRRRSKIAMSMGSSMELTVADVQAAKIRGQRREPQGCPGYWSRRLETREESWRSSSAGSTARGAFPPPLCTGPDIAADAAIVLCSTTKKENRRSSALNSLGQVQGCAGPEERECDGLRKLHAAR